jgi:hypothetical membrane protein
VGDNSYSDFKIMPKVETMRQRFLWLCGLCGITSSVLSLVMVFAATIISPWFRWDTNALSEMGVGEVSLLFNSAMIIGGILNLIFSLGIREYLGREGLVKYGTFLIMLGSVSLAFVGIFTVSYPIFHGIVALGTFVLAPIGFILIGLNSKQSAMKKLSITTGIAALMTILILPAILLSLPFNVGFAVPEIIWSLIVATWIIFVGIKLLRCPHKTPWD